MILDNLNLNLLRVFESVYRTKSMTKAAGELFMTQSGVSQNIKNLEEILEVKLFDRVKQRPVPTPKAIKLFERCHPYFLELEDALAEIKEEERKMKGSVVIGLPIEYGNNVVLPLLSKWGKKHPGIEYKIIYGHASEMNQSLLQGEIDFAFVDSYGLDRAILSEKVGFETLMLCAHKNYMKTVPRVSKAKKYFESLEYIAYVEGSPVLKQWFKHHFDYTSMSYSLRAKLMDVQGMSRLIVEGFGCGVLPLHVVERLKKQGHDIYLFSGSGKPLLNTISMAYLDKRSFGEASLQTMTYLKENLKA